jgi:hypothetical protein
MPEKEIPEIRSGLRPFDNKLPERHSGAFRHKNIPGYIFVIVHFSDCGKRTACCPPFKI